MDKKAVNFEGVFPILVTPFNEKDQVDHESLRKVVQFMVNIGVQGVTVLGVLGEANRMVDSERREIIKTAVEAAQGKIPVVAGASNTGTASTAALSVMAQKEGASAVMVAPHKEPVSNQQKIFEMYKHVSDSISIPIVVQDHPASTQVQMPVDLLLRLVDEVENVGCIKEEATPTGQKLTALFAGMQKRMVPVLVGLGALYGFFDLERGAAGFNTGFAFPEVLLAMVKAAKQGDMDRLFEIYTRFLPLIVYEQQPGLAVRKEIYRMRGLIAHNRVRHPGATIDPETSEQLAKLLQRILPDKNLAQPVLV
jgi:4-hydroxy-tetrahydrodipicolinate synthase